MTDRIQTENLQDLLNIFDPKAQETEDVGGARILYTFDDSGSPIRERVGESFILDIKNPEISFFVSLPIEGAVQEGNIVPANYTEGLKDRYRLTQADLEQLIFDVGVAFDYGEEAIAQLLDK